MPLYMCNTNAGSLDDAAIEGIAKDITRIHCDVTAAPPDFVHAFFFENAAHIPDNGKSVHVTGTIRAGRTDDQMKQIAEEIMQSVHERAGVSKDQIDVSIGETPASWVMEGGDLLPEAR